MNRQTLLILAVAASASLGCSDSTDGTVGSESHWLPCQKTDDCDSDYICARNQCRPSDDLPDDWVGECDPSREVCAVVGSAPINDPEIETIDWEYGRGAIARPQGAGTCVIGDGDWFFGSGLTIEYNESGQMVRVGAQEIEYGPHGFTTSIRSPQHQVIYERDGVGRLLVKTERDSQTGAESGRRYAYDHLGRISHVEAFEGDVVRYETTVEWSDDGLSHTDFNSACREEGARIIRDSDGYVLRRDWPDCDAFGDPLGQYEREDGRFLRYYGLDRSNEEPNPTQSEAVYDERARLIAFEQLGGWAWDVNSQSGKSTIEWEGGWMRRIVVTRMQTGNVIDTVELTGDCWLTVDQVRQWTPLGTVLGNAGL